jgi:predicted patatin/cPLA2 family phospholipase
MKGRNGRIYRDYSLRPEFIDFGRFLRGGHLLDLDWLWEITIREIRLDLAAIYARRKPFIVVLTDVLTGQASYRQTAAEDLEHTLKVSSAIPLLYRRYPEVDGRPSTDGGITDAIPVSEAIRRGARHIMVIRSRPRDYFKRSGISDRLLIRHARSSPLLGEAMKRRARRYNESVALIRKPPAGIEIVEVCPPGDFRVSRLSRDRRVLDEGYEQGHREAGEAIRRWRTG